MQIRHLEPLYGRGTSYKTKKRLRRKVLYMYNKIKIEQVEMKLLPVFTFKPRIVLALSSNTEISSKDYKITNYKNSRTRKGWLATRKAS